MPLPTAAAWVVAAGADVTVRDQRGQNCVHYLVLGNRTGCLPAVAATLPLGDFVARWRLLNAVNVHGLTPLHYAVSQSPIELVAELLSFGASLVIKVIDMRYYTGLNPLRLHVLYGCRWICNGAPIVSACWACLYRCSYSDCCCNAFC